MFQLRSQHSCLHLGTMWYQKYLFKSNFFLTAMKYLHSKLYSMTILESHRTLGRINYLYLVRYFYLLMKAIVSEATPYSKLWIYEIQSLL